MLILGTSHLANPDNGDLFMPETEDVLTEMRQLEIDELIEALKGYKPTKVALEVLTERENELNRECHAYLTGDFILTASERHQLGFRLAKEVGLPEVAAVDWNERIEGIQDIGAWVADNGSELFEEVKDTGRTMKEEVEEFLKTHTVKEYLLWLNQPENTRRNQESYMKLALIGDRANPVGAAWTAQYWYFRNMLIYRNIIKLAPSPNERIFVLYGAGHLHLLIQFLQDSGLINVETVNNYLSQ